MLASEKSLRFGTVNKRTEQRARKGFFDLSPLNHRTELNAAKLAQHGELRYKAAEQL